jgi:PhzF family phenazine biosynthesis protein
MKLHRMLCFGRNDETGNAAIVVEGAALTTEAERLQFARQQNAGATVFVEADTAGGAQLDYYYPHARSPLCLHATLAAGAVFFERDPHTPRICFVTSMHRQELEVVRIDGDIFIGVTPQRCAVPALDAAEAAQLLQVDRTNLLGAPQFASVGSAKLLVEVRDQSVLDALRPDLAAITSWSRKHGVSGLYVYCHLHDDVYAGRNFNHLDPQLEDVATGVAAGAMASSLKKSLTLRQGDALGKPCTLLARYADGAVQVGGRAIRSVV